MFDFLTFDIFLTNCHLFDILTSFNLNHLSPSQGYFLHVRPLRLVSCLLLDDVRLRLLSFLPMEPDWTLAPDFIDD